jgi:hypothetical protein
MSYTAGLDAEISSITVWTDILEGVNADKPIIVGISVRLTAIMHVYIPDDAIL